MLKIIYGRESSTLEQISTQVQRRFPLYVDKR